MAVQKEEAGLKSIISRLSKIAKDGTREEFGKALEELSAGDREVIEMMEEGTIYDEAHMNERCTE